MRKYIPTTVRGDFFSCLKYKRFMTKHFGYGKPVAKSLRLKMRLRLQRWFKL